MIPAPEDAQHDDRAELASLFATAYIRLLASRGADAARRKHLDVAGDNEAPLSERVSRRTKRA
jgi:hypothetical protein